MKIKALKTFRDPRGNFRRGMPGDVPDAYGKELIAAKLAEPLASDESEAPSGKRSKKKSED